MATLTQEQLLRRTRRQLANQFGRPDVVLSTLQQKLKGTDAKCLLSIRRNDEVLHQIMVTDDPRWVELRVLDGERTIIPIVPFRTCILEGTSQHPREAAVSTLLNNLCSAMARKKTSGFSIEVVH